MNHRKPSQREALLQVLADGRFHSNAEINQVRRMTVNSRVAELRSKGYVIEHRRVRGDGPASYAYRLLSGPASESTCGDRNAGAGTESSAAVVESDVTSSAAEHGDLVRPAAALSLVSPVDVAALLEDNGFGELTEDEADWLEREGALFELIETQEANAPAWG